MCSCVFKSCKKWESIDGWYDEGGDDDDDDEEEDEDEDEDDDDDDDDDDPRSFQIIVWFLLITSKSSSDWGCTASSCCRIHMFHECNHANVQSSCWGAALELDGAISKL